jgi:5-methylcytosine-specific restriction endonuclease McrA
MSDKKKIRALFRTAVFERDHYICQVCMTRYDPKDLDAHHVRNRNEMPNGGYVMENGITLCKSCHISVEEAYFSTDPDPQLTPEALYLLIGSSRDIAWQKSLLLEK